MLFLLASLTLAAAPVDSFHVRVNAPADLPLTVTYRVHKQRPVIRRLTGSTEFQVPGEDIRLVVTSTTGSRDFEVQVRGPKRGINGSGRGSCAVEIDANRKGVTVNTDDTSACKSKSAAVRTM